MAMFSRRKDKSTSPADSIHANDDEVSRSYRAVWNGQVIAESDETIVLEGNQYFPLASVDQSLLVQSEQTSSCPWKGTASYYDVVADGKTVDGGAWYYPNPKEAASEIKDRVAFWRGIKVEAV